MNHSIILSLTLRDDMIKNSTNQDKDEDKIIDDLDITEEFSLFHIVEDSDWIVEVLVSLEEEHVDEISHHWDCDDQFKDQELWEEDECDECMNNEFWK